MLSSTNHRAAGFPPASVRAEDHMCVRGGDHHSPDQFAVGSVGRSRSARASNSTTRVRQSRNRSATGAGTVPSPSLSQPTSHWSSRAMPVAHHCAYDDRAMCSATRRSPCRTGGVATRTSSPPGPANTGRIDGFDERREQVVRRHLGQRHLRHPPRDLLRSDLRPLRFFGTGTVDDAGPSPPAGVELIGRQGHRGAERILVVLLTGRGIRRPHEREQHPAPRGGPTDNSSAVIIIPPSRSFLG